MRTLHRLMLTIAVLATGAVAQAADAPELGPRTRNVDQLHLDLAVRLDMDAGSIDGVARHRMAALEDDLLRVRLHLAGLDVAGARTGEGVACETSRKGDVLTIVLDRPRAKGEEFELEIRYAGRPSSGLWFFRPSAEHPDIPLQAWTQGEATDNRHWIPCYDLPDDRLTSTLRIDVPAGLQTLSNGAPSPVTATDPGRELHVWTLDREHPSYLISLVAGTFDDVVRDADGVEQHDLVPPGWGEHVNEIFGRTPSMMAFFREFTGQPYPWPRYAQVTVWDFMWGGMENTCATTLNMRALHKAGVRPDYSADGLVAHELAHQWFGDLITCRTFDHMWLNEGFATYFTDLWREHHEGADAFAVARLRSLESYLDAVELPALAARPRPAQPDACGDVDQHPYVKGSSVLHMLRGLLGAAAFRDGIRRYVLDARDRSVDSEVLRHALEEATGRNLRTFFEQWVYGSGYPRLAVSATTNAGGGPDALVLRVRQTQPATPEMPHFTLPVDVEIAWPDGSREVRRFVMEGAAAEWHVSGATAPTSWRIDPEGWLVARLDVARSRAEWETQLRDDPRVTGRLLAARALAAEGTSATKALAAAAAGDASHEVRAAAAEALGKIGGVHAVTALVSAASDDDSRVRSAALKALGTAPPATAAPTLIERLRSDPSDYAASEAAAALGATRAPEAFDALVAALDRDSHRDVVRREVMNGLTALGDPRGARVALPYTAYAWGKGAQHRLRHAALDAMVKLAPHAPQTGATVVQLIGDPYFRMRNWAAAHAADLGLVEAIPALEAGLAEVATRPGVERAFKRALARLR